MRHIQPVFFALATLFVFATTLPAQQPIVAPIHDVSMSTYADRLSALEAEVASMKGGEAGCGMDVCDQCGCAECCCPPTWYAGAELPYLEVHDTGIIIPAIPLMTPNFAAEPSYRVWIGRENCHGLGFRVTYFDFEDSAVETLIGGLPITTALGYDIYAIDLEATQRKTFCGWEIMLSGGARIAGIEQSLSVTAPGLFANILRDFDGAGITFASGFRRRIGDSRFGLYGNFRGSLLFGDADINATLIVPGLPPLGPAMIATLKDQTISVLEIQAGVEYNRETSYGNVFSRVGVEGQMWELPPVLLGLGDTNVGLFGPVFSVGLER